MSNHINEHRRNLLNRFGEAMSGEEWRREIARRLGPYHPDGARDMIDPSLVRRWASGERDQIPDWVMRALLHIAKPVGQIAREIQKHIEAK